MKKRASKKNFKSSKKWEKKDSHSRKKEDFKSTYKKKKIRRALKKILKNEFPLNFIST